MQLFKAALTDPKKELGSLLKLQTPMANFIAGGTPTVLRFGSKGF